MTKAGHLRIHSLGKLIAKKVLILAGDTDGNLGDLAIVTATCDRLRSIDADTRISMLTRYPERDANRLGIVPLKRGLRGLGALIRAAREADLVIVGGGGLFQDDDSLVKMPYWALRLLCFRLFAKRIVGLSIGAGPLHHSVSRLFARIALSTLHRVSVRDALALSVLQPLTKKRIVVVPDPAFLLHSSGRAAARKRLEDAGVPLDKPLVGVAVRRWFHTDSNLVPHSVASKVGLYRNRGRGLMTAFRGQVTTVLEELIRETGAHVVFLPTYNVPHENDLALCNELATRLPPGSCSILKLADPKLYMAVTGLLSVMLCGRMHPAILAAGEGTPIVGLSYNPKFLGTFSMLRHGTRCLSMNNFVRYEETRRLSAMLKEAILRPADFTPDTSELKHAASKYIEELVAPDAVRLRAPVAQAQHN